MTFSRMKWLMAMLLMSVVASNRMVGQGPQSSSDVQKELTALYQRFIDGVAAHDSMRYRDLLTPDYVHVSDSINVQAGRTARFDFDLADRNRYAAFVVQRCKINVYGDAAVGPCWFQQRISSGPDKGVWNGVSLVTFIRGADHHWRIAATRPSSTSPAR